MISILVTGISGRMGQAVQEAVTQNPDTCVGATYDQGQELYPALAKCDVAIDFSHHAFTSTLLAEAVANNKPLVIGTTGHTELERQEIMDAAASIPIVFASNYSAGVNWKTAHASTSAETPPAWPRTLTPPFMKLSRPGATRLRKKLRST